MNRVLKVALAVAGVALATQAAAQIAFFERENFAGRSFTTERQLRNFERAGFNERASSVVVLRGRWEICEDARFDGRCIVVRRGRYPTLATMGLNDRVSSVRPVSRSATIDNDRYAPNPEFPRVTFYEREDFEGRSFTTDSQVNNIERHRFNDRASSAVVIGARWEVCEGTGFSGRCAVLRPGRYPTLAALDLNNRLSSARSLSSNARIDDRRYVPEPLAAHNYRRRNHEQLFEANVTSVRAVVGPPEQRCWVEREQVVHDRSNANVPGAIAGAIIGGILGHQVGGGRGQDIATAGGAVAGAAVGANVGRDGGSLQASGQNVQRCETLPSRARPEFWDVTYEFQRQEHHVQLTASPGPTITVNEQGEPRE